MKTVLIFCMVVLVTAAGSAQLKTQNPPEQSVAHSLVRPGGNLSSFFGLLNPDNFMMRHNLSYSYMSYGGTGLSVASYTNSIFYKIADPLNVRFDVTLQGSPFGPTAGADRNHLNRVFLSRAEINYQPWEDFFIQVQYRELPYSSFRDLYNPFSYGLFRGDR